jgi:hypothetical protein
MKVTLQFDGKSITVNASSGFKVLVDDEVLLEHEGEVKRDAHKCCQGTYGSCHGASSLFQEEDANALQQEDGVIYINFAVPNSSFIETIRWWSYEEALGDRALEVHFKDGNYACYSDVPEYLVRDWITEIKAGGSAGRFYNINIKNEFESIMES